MKWRQAVFNVIELSDGENKISSIYDYCMIIVIIASLIPLAFKESNLVFDIIDVAAATVFIIDYLLRFVTADIKSHNRPIAFVKYPFTPMAIVDLVSILPTFLPLSAGFRLLKIFRLVRTLRVFRAVKMFRYSKSRKRP